MGLQPWAVTLAQGPYENWQCAGFHFRLQSWALEHYSTAALAFSRLAGEMSAGSWYSASFLDGNVGVP